jgi:transcriptional regulator with XRE-family HTH domain
VTTDESQKDYARRIRAEREAHGWSQKEAVRAMQAHGCRLGFNSLLRQWKFWEGGQRSPDRHNQKWIARTFGIPVETLFPTPQRTLRTADAGSLEILARMRASDLDRDTLDTLEQAVDKLGCDYGGEPHGLLAEGQLWLTRLNSLLERRLTLAQHRDILSLAGRTALLVGCVEYDLGQAQAAETTRQAALSLGEESGDAHVIGWAWEMRAWYDLTQGRHAEAVQATQAGLDAVGDDLSVGVQLAAHRAKAWARMGDPREVEVALDEGRRRLDQLPAGSDYRNHFVVDPAKWDFYTLDCYRHIGRDDLAGMYATEVIRTGTSPDGTVIRPMRVAEAHVTLGVVAARGGDLDRAVAEGRAALSAGRKSVPSLLMASRELLAVLRERWPHDAAVDTYADELRTLAT